MWIPPAGARVLFMAFVLSGCSSDDENDDDGGRYADIVEWRCFEGDDCWCPGLTAGNDAHSSDPRVEACSYTTCFVYHPDEDSDSWHCSCGSDGFMPGPFATGIESVPACPPE